MVPPPAWADGESGFGEPDRVGLVVAGRRGDEGVAVHGDLEAPAERCAVDGSGGGKWQIGEHAEDALAVGEVTVELVVVEAAGGVGACGGGLDGFEVGSGDENAG